MAIEEPHLLPGPKLDSKKSPSESDGELVIGLVGAVGTELKRVEDVLEERLGIAGYDVVHIRISRKIIPLIVKPRDEAPANEYDRISWAMDDGDTAREKSGDNSILALGAASLISSKRDKDPNGSPKLARRRAYIIHSLKHQEEVYRLREIYPLGFYLIGVHSDKDRRIKFLKEEKQMLAREAKALIARDEREDKRFGQHLTDTFHLSDFFVLIDDNQDRLKYSVWRFVEVLFGDPYKTPTFDEYAMFLAFATSLRSADLARQVGAVIARQNEILSTGANDCPRFDGGLYWPEYSKQTKQIGDSPRGRDYKRKKDSNKDEQQEIINDIVRLGSESGLDRKALRNILERSRIKELTEFGRAVHAEMEALLACARNRVMSRAATLYCTTFPCHNCAKHIIAAGIHRVVYIEPYEKSKAEKLHGEALSVGFPTASTRKVRFEPFVGFGPRRFLDFFSMRLGSGEFLTRKNEKDRTISWDLNKSRLRVQMLSSSYLDLELKASRLFNQARQKESGTNAI